MIFSTQYDPIPGCKDYLVRSTNKLNKLFLSDGDQWFRKGEVCMAEFMTSGQNA